MEINTYRKKKHIQEIKFIFFQGWVGVCGCACVSFLGFLHYFKTVDVQHWTHTHIQDVVKRLMMQKTKRTKPVI